ncbi:Peptide deformylase 1A, chloroplastic [Apostasia shenzhenica]|uniref:Peptide deformylase n=1 Tax=Apostasia shenzhenica TaxID=1088818 RepID=A0A2I0AE03_9ASPA|nr:Peptide deformylase 1A, chloroplastic [Apostasia shenzhenica]
MNVPYQISYSVLLRPPEMAAVHRLATLVPISRSVVFQKHGDFPTGWHLSLSPKSFRIHRTLRISLSPFSIFQKHGDTTAGDAAAGFHLPYHGVDCRRRTDTRASAGLFSGFGSKKVKLPEIVKTGDPVLHEPAGEVPFEEIGLEKIQMIIDDMVGVMRKAPGVGLAAPQIGISYRIIVLEDTKEYISYAPKNEIEAQDRHPFDLLVIINPKLKKLGSRTALFFEGCLSVNGFRGMVERHLQVEVTGYGRHGQPIKVDATGWQARILQHECDHLDGIIYVDKIIPRTFRTVDNLHLPLPAGCPQPGNTAQAELMRTHTRALIVAGSRAVAGMLQLPTRKMRIAVAYEEDEDGTNNF